MTEEKSNEEKSEITPNKEVRISTVLYATFIVVALIILIFGIVIYGFGLNNKLISRVESIIPYPVVIINYSSFIPFNYFNENIESLRKFYEEQDFASAGVRIDFSTPEGKNKFKILEKQALNKIIEDRVIEVLAKERGINVSGELVDQSIDRKIKEYGTTEAFEKNIKKLYGWTPEDFKKRIIKPSLYKEELEKSFDKENNFDEAKSEIEKAQLELENGGDFSEVVKNYSKGVTSEEGGDLGWFRKDQIIEEISEEIFAMKKGSQSGILESRLGFHIVSVNDKKTEEGEVIIKIRQIFVPKNTFAEWLGEQMKDMNFFILHKDYYWDKENLFAEFKDEDIRKFEREIEKSLVEKISESQ